MRINQSLMKTYTINTVSEILGISGETIRYYEKQGLIRPRRSSSGYRHYSALDVSVIIRLKYYQSLGFSLKECGEMINAYEAEEVQQALDKQIQRARDRIRQAEFQLEAAIRASEKVRNLVQLLGRCAVATSPAFYYLAYRDTEMLLPDKKVGSKMPAWLDAMPCVNAGPLFPLENIKTGGGYLFGLVIEQSLAELFRLDVSFPVISVPSQTCVTMVLEIKGHEAMSADCLEPLLSFAEKNGYCPCGDAVGKSIATTHAITTRERYHQIWLPVKPVE